MPRQMWGDPTRGKDAMLPEEEDVAAFNEKAAKFNDAETAFRSLVDALASYKTAVMQMTECGVAVAENIDKFFVAKDAQRDLSAKFLDAQISVRAKWVGDLEKRYDANVLRPVKSRVDEIPKVREYMKEREAAKAEMIKRKKRLNADRKKDGQRQRDKQRKLNEIVDRFAMFNDEVTQRFSFIERNLANFVSPPLRAMVSLLSEFASSAVTTLHDVEQLVTVIPPMTRELSPAPRDAKHSSMGGIVDSETWDDAYQFDEDDEDELGTDRDSAYAPRKSESPASTVAHRSTDPPSSTNTRNSGPTTALDINLPLDLPLPTSPHSSEHVTTPGVRPVVPNGTAIGDFAVSPMAAHGASGNSFAHEGTVPLVVSPRHRTNHSMDGGFVPSIGTSAGSSASTDIIVTETASRVRATFTTEGLNRRGAREGMISGDTATSVASSDVTGRVDVLMRVRAEYDYTPREPNEIEFRKRDVIEVTAKDRSGWWLGRCRRAVGYFPANHTRELTEQEEIEYLKEKQRRKCERRQGHRRRDSRESRPSARSVSHSSSIQATPA